MEEANGRKPARNLRTFGLIAVTVVGAISLALIYHFGVFDSESRGHIKADSVCENLHDRKGAAEVFNSALPQFSSYDFQEQLNPPADYSYRSNCEVLGNQDTALLDLTANMAFAEAWQKWEKKVIKPRSHGEITYFDAGIRGVSSSNLAGIYVPCYTRERSSKQAHNLNVIALAIEPLQGSEKTKRQKLIALALDYAHTAHKQAKCDLPSKLPNRVLRLNS
ncbi:hypothetical protein ACGFSB_03620 [Streptomyces sp. NPDC048441]|uniref:hypothetical protein n=1 Tax=Streptomyces sp. NPDC048441 TaxID=3365552 RepID=UPI00371D647E